MLVWLVPAAFFFTLFAFVLQRQSRAATEVVCKLERNVRHPHPQTLLRAALPVLAGNLGTVLDEPEVATLREAIARAPLQCYRSATCGFEAQRHFWQCTCCLAKNTYPPQRIEEA
jgi:lipopolysaccharide biosynthesis regulator YciM